MVLALLLLLLSCAPKVGGETIYTTGWVRSTPPPVRVCDDVGMSADDVYGILRDLEKHGGPRYSPDMVTTVACPGKWHPQAGAITIHLMYLSLFLEDTTRYGVTIPETVGYCRAQSSFDYSGDCTIREASIFLVDVSPSTVTHELIHALGVLGHSKDDHSPMYTYNRPIEQQTEWASTQRALRRIWR